MEHYKSSRKKICAEIVDSFRGSAQDTLLLVQKVSDGSLNSWMALSEDNVLKTVIKFSKSRSPDFGMSVHVC